MIQKTSRLPFLDGKKVVATASTQPATISLVTATNLMECPKTPRTISATKAPSTTKSVNKTTKGGPKIAKLVNRSFNVMVAPFATTTRYGYLAESNPDAVAYLGFLTESPYGAATNHGNLAESSPDTTKMSEIS